MTSFNESDINRDRTGKFAPTETSETDFGSLDLSDEQELDYAPIENYPDEMPPSETWEVDPETAPF